MAGDKTQVWNSAFEATPAGTDRIRDGDDRIRELKSAIQERIAQEHEMSLVEGGAQPRQGLHKAGSARGWYQASAPTKLANGDDLGTSDAGAVWIDSDTKVPHMWNGSAWTALTADDALKVSGYGIGVTDSAPINDFDVQHKSGTYRTEPGATGHPPQADGYFILQVLGYTSDWTKQIAYEIGAVTGRYRIYERSFIGGATWLDWYEVWNAYSDGNGGQPPSAKSNKTSNATIGWFDSVDCASGAQVTLPASGTFEWFVTTYGATYNSVKSGVSAGGLMTGTASANLTMWYKRLS